MNKVPCEDCVTFAICNSLIGTSKYKDVTNLARNKRCSLLMDYIDHKFGRKALVDEARAIFGLPPVKWY